MQKLVVLLVPTVVGARKAVAALRVAEAEHHLQATDLALAYKDEHLRVHLEERHGSWRPAAHSARTLESLEHALDAGEAMVLVLTDEASATNIVEGLSARVGANLAGVEIADLEKVRATTYDVGDEHHVYKVLRELRL